VGASAGNCFLIIPMIASIISFISSSYSNSNLVFKPSPEYLNSRKSIISSFEGIPESAFVYRVWLDGIKSYHNIHKYYLPEVFECSFFFILILTVIKVLKSDYAFKFVNFELKIR